MPGVTVKYWLPVAATDRVWALYVNEKAKRLVFTDNRWYEHADIHELMSQFSWAQTPARTSHEVKRPPAPNKPNNRVRHRCRTPKNVNAMYTSAIKPRNLRNAAQMRPRTRNVRGHCSSHTSQNVGPTYLL